MGRYALIHRAQHQHLFARQIISRHPLVARMARRQQLLQGAINRTPRNVGPSAKRSGAGFKTSRPPPIDRPDTLPDAPLPTTFSDTPSEVADQQAAMMNQRLEVPDEESSVSAGHPDQPPEGQLTQRTEANNSAPEAPLTQPEV